MTIINIHVLFGSTEEAERIGKQMVEEKLAACVNIGSPCRSIYRWEGKTEQAEEIPADFKTRAELGGRLMDRISELHSYDVPAIMAETVKSTTPDYAKWTLENTQIS